MSNYLSVATVTASLMQVIQEAVLPKVPGVTVTATRPSGSETGVQPARVNVYLYQVMTNRSWRNEDLPSRLADGAIIQRPMVALDLLYLISFYGDEINFVQQRLLAAVVAAVHTYPVLDPARFARTREALDGLKDSDLADSGESITLSPMPASMDELWRLWGMFQAPFALSVLYKASVLTVGCDEIVPGAALPVRGG